MSNLDAAAAGLRTLRDLIAEPQAYTTAAGERLEVAPLKVRQLAAFARAVAPVLQVLPAIAGAQQSMLPLAAVVAERCDDVAAAVAVATGKSATWVGDLDLADLAGLAALVVEVNADFFIRRLLPTLEQAMPALAARLAGLVPTPAPAGSA